MNRKKIINYLAVFLLISFLSFTRTTLISNAQGEIANEAEIMELIREAWKNQREEIKLGSYKIKFDDFKKIYNKMYYSESKYFYVSGSFSGYSSGQYMTSATIGYNVSTDKIAGMRYEYDQAVAGFKKGVDSNWSDMKKLLYINNYLCKICQYDYDKVNPNKYDAYGALVGHMAVCEGYSRAFDDLADEVGLECYLVGSDTLNHAWNMVKLNGKYYMIDATWNDSKYDFSGVSSRYFLKSASWFNSSDGHHVASDYYTKGIGPDPSVANDTSYDYCDWNGYYSYLELVKGEIYGTDNNGRIVKYSSTNNSIKTEKTIADYTKTNWKNYGPGGGYYQSIYSMKIASFGNKLYYTSPYSVLSYNVETGEIKTVYALTDDEKSNNCIYGLVITQDNKIKYHLSKGVNSTEIEGGITKEVPTTYKAEFTWNSDYSKADVSIISMPLDGVMKLFSKVNSVTTKNEATCTQGGSATYTVSVSYNGQSYKDSKDVNLKPLGHNITSHSAAQATCTAKGNSQYWSCDRCNKYFSDKNGNTEIKKDSWVIAAKGHKYGTLIAEVPTTCKASGVKEHYKCSACQKLFVKNGNEYVQKTDKDLVIKQLDHHYEEISGTAIDPTCTAAGKEADKKCSVCNEVLKGADIPALGHHWDEGVVTQEATSDRDGIKTYTCTECKAIRIENIPGGNGGSEEPSISSAPTPAGDSPSEKTTGSATTTEQSTNPTTEQAGESTKEENNNSDAVEQQPDGQGYYDIETINEEKVTQNVKISDKTSSGKYKITKVTRKNGKIVGGTVTYMAPYNKNCLKATVPATIRIRGVKFTVTAVNKGAFKNHKKLKTVTIGTNVTNIGANAFSGCSKLSNVNIRSTKIKKIGSKAFKGINKKAKIKVPKKRLEKYKKMLYKAGVTSKTKITN